MAIEIERKFTVVDQTWRLVIRESRHIADYLIARFENEDGKARVRVCDGDYVLTIKGPRRGATRSEFHITLSEDEGRSMVAEFARGSALAKVRHEVDHGGLVWQVDEFLGPLAGLVTCEVELPSEDYQFEKPTWAGDDITGDVRYSSGTLAGSLTNSG